MREAALAQFRVLSIADKRLFIKHLVLTLQVVGGNAEQRCVLDRLSHRLAQQAKCQNDELDGCLRDLIFGSDVSAVGIEEQVMAACTYAGSGLAMAAKVGLN